MYRPSRSPRRPRQAVSLRLEQLEERCVLSLLGLDLAAGAVPLSSVLASAGLIGTEATVDGTTVPAWLLGEAGDGPGRAPSVALQSGEEIVLAGFIGDAPGLAPAAQPNDVDFFTLRVDGNGMQAVRFELLGPSVGSTLDPSLAVFDADGTLIWSGSATQWFDLPEGAHASEVFATLALTPGTYVIAVSASGNEAGVANGYSWADPLGGNAGNSTGWFALVVSSEEAGAPPSVLGANITEGATLDHAPGYIELTLSEPVSTAALLGGEFYLLSENGDRIDLSPTYYAPETGILRLSLPDRLANGSYTLVVTSESLVDGAAQTALEDFTLHFTVDASVQWGEPGGTDVAELDLGFLFTAELISGVNLTGSLPAGDTDSYRFELLAAGAYQFSWNGPEGAQFILVDASGQAVASWTSSGTAVVAGLQPGQYRLLIVQQGDTGAYELELKAILLTGGQLELDVDVPQVTLKISSLPSFAAPAAESDPAVAHVLDVAQNLVWETLREVESQEVVATGGTEDTTLRSVDTTGTYTAPLLVIDPFTGKSKPVSGEQLQQSLEQLANESLTHRPEPGPDLGLLGAALYAIRYADGPPAESDPEVDWAELVQETMQESEEFHDAAAVAQQVLERRVADSPTAEDVAVVEPLSQPGEDSSPQTLMLLTASAGATLGGTAAKSLTLRRMLANLLRRLADRIA